MPAVDSHGAVLTTGIRQAISISDAAYACNTVFPLLVVLEHVHLSTWGFMRPSQPDTLRIDAWEHLYYFMDGLVQISLPYRASGSLHIDLPALAVAHL